MRYSLSATVLSVLCATALSSAAPLGPGTRLAPLALLDQHDVTGSVGPDSRCIVFSRDMDAGNIVKEALATDSATLLEPAKAVVVSDISGMPGVISKLFAVPALRKRRYRILLDRDGKATADIPSEESKVTVLVLQALTIESVTYIDSAAALRAALTQAASQASKK